MFRIKRILVPCDFSQFSDAAIRRACDLAVMMDAGLHLLHVVSPSPLLGRVEPEADRLRDAKQQPERQLDPHIVVKLCVERTAVTGSPHREICRYAEEHDIDLIVMGTHGRTGLAHVALGSVAENVLRCAPCPVLIVRHPDQGDDLVRQAAKVLGDEFGPALAGEFGETRASLKGRLMRILNVSEQAAELAIEKLRSEDALFWDQQSPDVASHPRVGKWRIGPDAAAGDVPDVELRSETSPAIDLVSRAVALRATDIHLDVMSQGYDVRFRIDGRLQRYCTLDPQVAAHLIQQLKTMAQLDIADPFHPQEGRLRLPPELADLEVRMTTSPVSGGEAVALRVFDREHVFRPLHRLGLSDHSLALIDEITRRGEGLVLVTGPTGSGKTTTVYSMLEALGGGERNIVSIEDPVEFPVSFVRQVEMDEQHGINMSSGMRTLLRMDPDVVFLGEIRDAEAAEIAMRAASSGKYVFSTLHTRDVASTVTALRDLHIDSRSLSGNLTGIISQRLVRRLCPQCRLLRPAGDSERSLFQMHGIEPPSQLFQPVGCSNCRGTGYRGRIGVFEVVLATFEFTQEIARGTTKHELRSLVRSGGTPDLVTDALVKVCDGATCLDEAIRMRAV